MPEKSHGNTLCNISVGTKWPTRKRSREHKPYCISPIPSSQVSPIQQLALTSLPPPSQTLRIEVVPKLLLASPWQLILGLSTHSRGEVRPRFQVQLRMANQSLSITAFGRLTWSTKCQWNQTIKDLAFCRYSENRLNSLIKWQKQLSLRCKIKGKLNSWVEIWGRKLERQPMKAWTESDPPEKNENVGT